MIPPDLPALAETVANWADAAPGVPDVYLFGSRVRGDHRFGSDVDLFLFQEEWDATSESVDWWQAQSMAEYRDLGDALPGPLHILLETYDAARDAVLAARADPSRIVLQVRKVTCLWTPPKPARPLRARPAPQGQTPTPADYLASIVLPTLHEFTADPSDRRRAYLACIVAAHIVDHVARATKKPQSDVRSVVRALGAFAGECFDLVEAICKGAKHAAPDRPVASGRRSRRPRPEPVQFAPGWEKGVEADSLGGVLAARGHRRWERPGLTVELPGKAEGDEDRFIDESVEGLIAACIMAFPDLFPGTDPLSVAPWLQIARDSPTATE